MQDRSALIVYFKSPKVLKRLKKTGNISYFNKKRKYAVIYINASESESVKKTLLSLRHIKRVDDSKLDYSPYSLKEEKDSKPLKDASTEEEKK